MAVIITLALATLDRIGRPYSYISKVSKIDCLRFVMCLLLVPVLKGFFSFFFAVAVYSTNKANKAGSMRC
jgi:hypothetical protein